jgi:hypothetical protein
MQQAHLYQVTHILPYIDIGEALQLTKIKVQV